MKIAAQLFKSSNPKSLQSTLKYAYTDCGNHEALMVRHAQSEFNKFVHMPKTFLSQHPHSNFHLDINLIDCSLSS